MPRFQRTVALLALACLVAAPARAQIDTSTMRTYFVVLMKRGTAPAAPKAEVFDVVMAHLASMQKLAEARQLVAFGPIDDPESELRAVFVFDVATREEATRIAEEDPAVKTGRFTPVVLEWFAEKGIGEAYFARVAGDPGVKVAAIDYQFGLLMRAPTADAVAADRLPEIQKGHMAHIGRMAEDGVLVAAGPFKDDGDYRGIFVFRAPSVDAARKVAEADPAIQAGRLRLDLYPWKVAEGVFRK